MFVAREAVEPSLDCLAVNPAGHPSAFFVVAKYVNTVFVFYTTMLHRNFLVFALDVARFVFVLPA